ncbi:hypothetical protein GGR21_002956 [Dysgonomonas hofstadii]|uniref:Uncharacterized protein n=1 Tax=Dysgonomonas hofstadii TaxID=637886 RepID=A0A840CX77_9BACT|nr:hypothetical protein [Dysgonomonas hofstadii]
MLYPIVMLNGVKHLLRKEILRYTQDDRDILFALLIASTFKWRII